MKENIFFKPLSKKTWLFFAVTWHLLSKPVTAGWSWQTAPDSLSAMIPSLTPSLAKASTGPAQARLSRNQAEAEDKGESVALENSLSSDSTEAISSVQSTCPAVWRWAADRTDTELFLTASPRLYLYGFLRMLTLTWHKFSLQHETPSRQGPVDERVTKEYPML